MINFAKFVKNRKDIPNQMKFEDDDFDLRGKKTSAATTAKKVVEEDDDDEPPFELSTGKKETAKTESKSHDIEVPGRLQSIDSEVSITQAVGGNFYKASMKASASIDPGGDVDEQVSQLNAYVRLKCYQHLDQLKKTR